MRRVGGSKSAREAARLIEAMDARIGLAALQQDMVAVLFPGFRKRRTDDGPAVPLALIAGMGRDILYYSVPATVPQKIGNGNQHAGCDNPGILIRYKDEKPIARESFLPDAFGHFPGFGVSTDIGRFEQRKQAGKIGGDCGSSNRHAASDSIGGLGLILYRAAAVSGVTGHDKI
jgi:hypothetical protein